MAPDERAAKGVFLAFQYPVEIPGVTTMNFLHTALNAQRKARGEPELMAPDFLRKVREVSNSLNIPMDMLKRGVNVGFSGGEKKRNEVLQMALFQPSLCILDEMDSGLDIDALRVAADGVNALRSKDRAMVVITHYQRLLTTSCRFRPTSCRRAAWSRAAARNWRWSWKSPVTPSSKTRQRKRVQS